MHHPTDRITHTTAFVTPVVEHWLEREIAQWVNPIDPTIHRTMSERSTSELRPAPCGENDSDSMMEKRGGGGGQTGEEVEEATKNSITI